MKRIALSLITLVTALAVGSFATLGAWTDTVTVTGNVISTGAINLLVDTDGDGSFSDSTEPSNFVFTGLLPSATPTDGGYAFSLLNDDTNGSIILNLTAEVLPNAVIAPSTDTNGNPVTINRDHLYITVYDINTNLDVSAETPLSAWEAGPVSVGSIDPGLVNARDYGFRVRLDQNAINDWQGETVTFTLSVTGTTP